MIRKRRFRWYIDRHHIYSNAYVHPATLKVNHKCGKIGQESCNQSCTHLSCISSRRLSFRRARMTGFTYRQFIIL